MKARIGFVAGYSAVVLVGLMSGLMLGTGMDQSD